MPDFDEWKQEGVTWDEAPELWELHTGPHLTVGALMEVLTRCDPALPIHVAMYDGTEDHTVFDPVEVGNTGDGPRPAAVLLTVAALPQ